MAAGTITTHRANRDDGRGFGIIAPDDGGPEIFFSSASAEGRLHAFRRFFSTLGRRGAAGTTPFDLLHRGQRVRYVVGENAHQAGRACAEHVRPLAD